MFRKRIFSISTFTAIPSLILVTCFLCSGCASFLSQTHDSGTSYLEVYNRSTAEAALCWTVRAEIQSEWPDAATEKYIQNIADSRNVEINSPNRTLVRERRVPRNSPHRAFGREVIQFIRNIRRNVEQESWHCGLRSGTERNNPLVGEIIIKVINYKYPIVLHFPEQHSDRPGIPARIWRGKGEGSVRNVTDLPWAVISFKYKRKQVARSIVSCQISLSTHSNLYPDSLWTTSLWSSNVVRDSLRRMAIEDAGTLNPSHVMSILFEPTLDAIYEFFDEIAADESRLPRRPKDSD